MIKLITRKTKKKILYEEYFKVLNLWLNKNEEIERLKKENYELKKYLPNPNITYIFKEDLKKYKNQIEELKKENKWFLDNWSREEIKKKEKKESE